MKERRPGRAKSGPTKAEFAARVDVLEHALKRERARRQKAEEALKAGIEQQTATSEILRIISTSRADAQPVLDAIARSAVTTSVAMSRRHFPNARSS